MPTSALDLMGLSVLSKPLRLWTLGAMWASPPTRGGELSKNKNAASDWQRIYQPRESDGPLNLIGTEASGTSVHMAGSSIDNGLDPLDIGLPGTVGTSVGVGNLDAEGYVLSANFTFSHLSAPP